MKSIRKNNKNRCGLAAVFLALALAVSPASADIIYSNGGPSITMEQLLAGGSIIVTSGDVSVEFKNWAGYISEETGGAATASASDIVVTGVEDGSKLGLHYQSAVFFAGTGQTQDTMWEYEVDIAGGAASSMDLKISGFSTQGTGRITVFENATNGLVDVGDTFVIDSANQTQSFNWDMFEEPENWFLIDKDVALVGGDTLAGFSGMTQTFDIGIIPEPASLALLTLGSLALVRRRRPS